MEAVTDEVPVLWGRNMIGYGSYHYRYKTGQEGDFVKIGFTPRENGTIIDVMSGLRGFEHILARLGNHTASKSTVKFGWLHDIDRSALEKLVGESVAHLDSVTNELGSIPRMSDIPPRKVG